MMMIEVLLSLALWATFRGFGGGHGLEFGAWR